MRLSYFFYLILAISVSVSISLLFQQSIRLDEAQSLWVSTKPVTSIFNLIGQDVHVPLYEVLLHFWLQIFGATVTSARVISLIFYIGTLPVLYTLAKESSNQRVARVTTALFAVSPFVVWYSDEARMYTLFTLVASLASLSFLRVIRSNGSKSKFFYFVSCLFGLYTHYFFAFLLGVQFLYVTYKFFLSVVPNGKKLAFKVYGIQAAAFAFFLPWAVYAISLGVGSNTQPLIPEPTSYNIFQTLVLFTFGFQSQFLQSAVVSLWPLAIAVLFIILTRKLSLSSQNTDYFIMTSIVPVLIVFIVSLFKPIFLARYLIFVIPSFFYLLALIFLGFRHRISTVLTGLVLLLMASLLIYQSVSASTNVKEDYRSVVDYVEQQATPQDVVVVSAPFTVYPIEYYYHGRAKIETIPEWNRYQHGGIPPFQEQQLEQQMQRYQTQYQRMFLILSYDQGYENTIKNYMDSHYQRLDIKDYSPGLELRVYKLRYDI